MHIHVNHMIYDFATEATKKVKSININNPDETISYCSYLQNEIKYIAGQAIERELDINRRAIDVALQAAIEYGDQGAAHHIQYVIGLMVKALTNSDEAKLSQFKAEFKEKWNEEWDEGIAP